MTSEHAGRTLKTVATTFDIVDALESNGGKTLDELAEHLDIARSTVHGHLSTLEQYGYVVRENGEYRLGMSFLRKGGVVRSQHNEYDIVISKVDELAQEVGERAQFIVEEHGRGTYVHTVIENNSVSVDARIGKQIPLHASSGGKSILAHLSPERRNAILEQRGLRALTDNTITDRVALDSELDDIRERGYAVSDQESIDGIRAIGAPIVTDDGVLGALSVSGPAHRMSGKWFHEELPDLLLGTVDEIKLNVAYQ